MACDHGRTHTRPAWAKQASGRRGLPWRTFVVNVRAMSDLTASGRGSAARAPAGAGSSPSGSPSLCWASSPGSTSSPSPSPASSSSARCCWWPACSRSCTPSWTASGAAFALHLLVGMLYVIGGFLLMAEPLEGSVVITDPGGGRADHRRHPAHRHRRPASAHAGLGPDAGERRDQPAGRTDAVCDAAVVGAVGGRHADRRRADRSGCLWIQFGLGLRRTA